MGFFFDFEFPIKWRAEFEGSERVGVAKVCIVLGLCLALAGCARGSGSSFLPSLGSLNPFSSPEEDTPDVRRLAGTSVVPGSILVPGEFTIEAQPALRGLILVVRTVAPTQGYHSAELAPERRGAPDEDGIVSLQFRIVPPFEEAPVGAARSRQITAAYFVGDDDLADIRGFEILGASSSKSLAR